MGQRANLAIGNAGGYELYYSHWCANTLPRDLFWGPSHAFEFVSRQRKVDPVAGWLDTVWAEGGAVIDPASKTLMLFGGEDVLYDVPLRRVFLQFLHVAWDGWTIRWAYEGIADIAEFLGVPRETVIVESRDEDDCVQSLNPPEEKGWLQTIGTFLIDERLKIFPLPGLPEDYVLGGPDLLEASATETHFEAFDVSSWTNEFPLGGFHVSAAERRLHFWIANDCPNLESEAKSVWRDWEVVWHRDQYESQVELANSRLVMNARSRPELMEDVIATLDKDSKPVDVLGLARRLAEHDEGRIKINPMALRDDRIEVSPERRRELLARCVAAVNSGERDVQ